MITQDESTKCTDPADREAVIRELRIKLNDKQSIIDSMREDAEQAHSNIDKALRRDYPIPLLVATQDAIQRIIESLGTLPLPQPEEP